MERFIEAALKMADESVTFLKRYFRSDVDINTKADGSPVTLADRLAEDAMRQIITRFFPDHGIIGEEYGLHQPHADYQWTLDPIDGTKNFIAGSFLFGSLIGLMHNRKPILGVLCHPLMEQVVLGVSGKATTLNGDKIHVRSCDRIEDALILSTTHWGVEKHHEMAGYEALTRKAAAYQTWGDCHGYYLLATGGADVMLDPKMNIWDVAPLVPIIEGAGGKITDWYGNNPIDGRGVVASNGVLHDKVLALLNSNDAE